MSKLNLQSSGLQDLRQGDTFDWHPTSPRMKVKQQNHVEENEKELSVFHKLIEQDHLVLVMKQAFVKYKATLPLQKSIKKMVNPCSSTSEFDTKKYLASFESYHIIWKSLFPTKKMSEDQNETTFQKPHYLLERQVSEPLWPNKRGNCFL